MLNPIIRHMGEKNAFEGKYRRGEEKEYTTTCDDHGWLIQNATEEGRTSRGGAGK